MNPSNLLQLHLQRSQVIGKDSVGVVAVSGGADSMALLHALVQLRRTQHMILYVATFDHGLRGQQSAEDAAFVGQMSQAWRTQYYIGQGHLDPAAPGVETRARAARYAFFAQIIRAVGADWLATAHHADDQAETVLMHLIRGSGVRGLRGMKSVSSVPNEPNQTLVRPFLGVRRADLLAYCALNDVPYRHDPTNDDPVYRRNWVRHIALPTLAQANPDINGALVRLSDAAGLDEALLETLTQPVIQVASVTEHRVIFPREAFSTLHAALRVRAVAWACGRFDSSEPPTFERLRGAAALADGQTGGRWELPGGLRARLEHDAFIVERVTAPDSDSVPGLEVQPGMVYPLTLGEWCALPNGGAVCWLGQTGAGGVEFYAASGQAVALRTPRSGERVKLLGVGGHSKSLKDWLIDHKIPQRWRARLPILTVDDSPVALWDGKRWHQFGADFHSNHSLMVRLRL